MSRVAVLDTCIIDEINEIDITSCPSNLQPAPGGELIGGLLTLLGILFGGVSNTCGRSTNSINRLNRYLII